VTAPLCLRCGAELPDPLVRSVVTCPKCGAKSEARTRVPEDDEKPFTEEEIATREANRQKPLTADALASIERDIAAADATDSGLIFLDACMLLREVRRLRDAHAAGVVEVERLRAALAEALDGWEYAAKYKSAFLATKHGDAADIARLRALLPT
jgi:DNA-directed RNA polymerase subunit RPC12/RpoP